MGRKVKKIFKRVLPIAASVIGTAFGGPVGGAIGGAVGSAATGGNPLRGAITSYFGGQIGGALGNTIGSAAPSLASSTVGSTIGSGSGALGSSAIGQAISNTTLAEAGGRILGGAIADQTTGEQLSSPRGPAPELPSQNLTPALPNPTRPTSINAPNSLSSMGDLNDVQRRAFIATQGVSGSLPTDDEQSYYNNLIRRTLIDEGGNIQDLDTLLPVERQYIQQVLGFGGSDSLSLLRQLQFG